MDFLQLDTKTIGLVIGVLIIVVYVIVKQGRSNLTEGAAIFLGGNSVVGGIHLCILSFNKFRCDLDLEQSRIYVFLGGAAVIWISIVSIISKLKISPSA